MGAWRRHWPRDGEAQRLLRRRWRRLRNMEARGGDFALPKSVQCDKLGFGGRDLAVADKFAVDGRNRRQSRGYSVHAFQRGDN
jgi:hypothetical protein